MAGKEYSKTFCVYPWMHQVATPVGNVNFCCISERTFVRHDDGRPVDLATDSFEAAWNTNYMRDIRKKMLCGDPVKGCETCYEQEKIGKRSYRESHNEEWYSRLGKSEIESRVEDSRKKDFVVDKPPVYLDLRLGNLCNLKCRMCNPYNSVMIHKEWQELDQQTAGEYSNFWAKYNMKVGTVSKWYESENFWSDVEKYIPHLKKVYMTGGEPTLIESNYRFLDLCREKGYANKIELFFNLNFTNMSDKFIEQLSHFKWTSINASIDGFGSTNEYIRGSSKWDICDKNINKLLSKQISTIGFGFSPVIQIYNILNITSLLDYIESLIMKYNHDILIDFLYCFTPEFLDMESLPRAIKLEAKKKILEWAENSRLMRRKSEKSFFIKNSVESLLTRLDQTLEHENSEKIRDFMGYTNTLDQKRNQNFAQALPELARMLNESGY